MDGFNNNSGEMMQQPMMQQQAQNVMSQAQPQSQGTMPQQQPQGTMPQQQMMQQQPQGSMPQQQMYVPQHPAEPVSTGEWVLTMLILCVPVLNFVMLIIWSFDNNTAPSKSSWAKATLIWYAISLVITGVMMVMLGASAAAVISAISETFR